MADQLQCQATHQGLRGSGRKRTVLAQQARRLHGGLRMAHQARGLEFDAQRRGAPRRAVGQGVQVLEGALAVALI